MRKIANLSIEKLALGGFGIGFDAEKAVFVPYTVPGDKLSALVASERRDVVFARALDFSQRGNSYQEPACEAFGGRIPCGGCDWLMLPYNEQLRQKDILLRELLAPKKLADYLKPIIASPVEKHYRNKTFMPVGKGPSGMDFGIYARWSHRIVPHSKCLIHPPLFDTIAIRVVQLCQKAGVQPYDEHRHCGSLRHIGIRGNHDHSQVLLILVTRSAKLPFSNLLVRQLMEEFPFLSGIIQNINRERGNVILGNEENVLDGRPWLTDELGGLRFRVHYRSFWQANTCPANIIIEHIRSAVQTGWTVIDAFSGTGSIGICLAAKARQVICIEENSAATADGEYNATLNDISNTGFICAKVEDALPAILASASDGNPHLLVDNPDCVVLDPPRGGVPKDALQAIIDAAPKRVIYLSCSPITLARDLEILTSQGGYSVSFIQPFDMFPQTWHIECLTILDKGD